MFGPSDSYKLTGSTNLMIIEDNSIVKLLVFVIINWMILRSDITRVD